MKAEAKSQLIKHIVFAVIACAVAAFLFIGLAGTGVIMGIIMGILCAGVPFAWKWLSNIFVAFSITSIAIKAMLSVVLGWIAFPITIIKDVVAVCTAE